MGMDLKQKIMESLRSTWNSLHDFARAHRSESGTTTDSTDNSQGLENEVDQQVNSVMAQMVQQQHDADKSDTACKFFLWAFGEVHDQGHSLCVKCGQHEFVSERASGGDQSASMLGIEGAYIYSILHSPPK